MRTAGSSGRRTVLNERGSTRSLTGPQEVDSSVDRPAKGDPQSEQRLHLCAIAHEWADKIEHHTCQIRQQPKDWNQQMAHEFVLRMLVEANDASYATQHIEEERAEV